jgi:hypothetical protein
MEAVGSCPYQGNYTGMHLEELSKSLTIPVRKFADSRGLYAEFNYRALPLH